MMWSPTSDDNGDDDDSKYTAATLICRHKIEMRLLRLHLNLAMLLLPYKLIFHFPLLHLNLVMLPLPYKIKIRLFGFISNWLCYDCQTDHNSTFPAPSPFGDGSFSTQDQIANFQEPQTPVISHDATINHSANAQLQKANAMLF